MKNASERQEEIQTTVRVFPVPKSERWGLSEDCGPTTVMHVKLPGREAVVAEADRLFAEDGCVPLEREPTERLRTVEPASLVAEIGYPAPGDWSEVSCHGHLSLDYLIVVVHTSDAETSAVIVDTQQEFDLELKRQAFGLAQASAVSYVERKATAPPRGRIAEHDRPPALDELVNLQTYWEDVRAAQERAMRTNRLLEFRVEGDRQEAYYTVDAHEALGTYCRRCASGGAEVRLYVEFIQPGRLLVLDEVCLIGASL